MPANRRLMLAAACLTLGLAGHAALAWHLAPAAGAVIDLRAGLEEFPTRLTAEDPAGPGNREDLTWAGTEAPGVAEFRANAPYPIDSLVWRNYTATGHAPINLYLVYSRQSEDRNHHPEVCLREVAGAREDPTGRTVLRLGGDPNRPVQRFRFVTGAVRLLTVYYWHYTLEPVGLDRSSWLQQIHARSSRPMPSLTAQVTLAGGEVSPTADRPGDGQDAENRFLVQVDATLRRDFLPAGARMACDRKPVILLGK